MSEPSFASPASPVPEQFDAFSKQRVAIVITACLGAMATFLPWAHAPIVGSVAGSQGDGWFTLLLFAPALIVAFLGDVRKPLENPARFIASLASALAGAIGAYKIVQWNINMAKVAEDLQGNPFAELATTATRIGVGLYLLTAAGFALPAIAYWSKEGAIEKSPESPDGSTSSNPLIWLAAAALLVGLPLATLVAHTQRKNDIATFESVARELERPAGDVPVANAAFKPSSALQSSDNSMSSATFLHSWERSGEIPHSTFAFKGCHPLGDGRWIGEITNNSTQDYQLACFKLSLFDQAGELINTAAIVVSNIKAGQTKSFDAYAGQAPSAYKYKIDFENGF